MNKIHWLLSKLENLYVGWVYNPVIDVWNGFVDFHNARVDRRNAKRVVINEDDEGLFATVDGQEHRIREHWFETDMLKILSKATGKPVSQLKQPRKPKKRLRRP